MSTQIVDTKVKQQIDQIATIKKSVSAFMKTILATTPDGTPAGSEMPTFWNIVDSSNDQDYENTVKGQVITDIDNSLLGGGSIGNIMSAWFDYHESYYQLKRGFSGGFSGWLDSIHYRVSEDFNLAYEESRGFSLDPKYVFMDNSNYLFANIVGTVITLQNLGIIKSGNGDTKLAVKMASGTASGNATLSLVLGDQTDETTRTIDVAIPSGLTGSVEVIVGQVTPTAVSAVGLTNVFTVPNIINFKANTYVTVYNTSTLAFEYVLVSSVTPTTGGAGTITVPALLMSTTVANLRIAPTFDKIITGTMSAAVGNLKIYANSDRVINIYP